jgi:CheY-like chemotaxis protein
MSKVQLLYKNKNILVLDDNELTRNHLKRKFEDLGAVVYSSGHLSKGISVLYGLVNQGDPPVLLIADTQLPGCFGLQVLQTLKDTLGSTVVPIIVASHGLNHLAVRRMVLFNVIGYVPKPTYTDELFNFAVELFEEYQNLKGAAVGTEISRAG